MSDGADLLRALSAVDPPVEVDFSRVPLASRPSSIGGHVWAKYATIDIAERSKARLHSFLHRGTYLSAQFELGVDACGRRIVRKDNHITTPIRRIASNSNSKSNSVNKFDYSSRSVVVNNTEYPFPTGLYLTRVMALQHRLSSCFHRIAVDDDCRCTAHLLDFVGSLSCRDSPGRLEQTRHYGIISSTRLAKELTEAMAMVDAIDRALKLLDLNRIYAPPGSSTLDNIMSSEIAALSDDCVMTRRDCDDGIPPTVRVFVLGDGVYPLCCALIALHYPYVSWHYYSIDPLLVPLTFPDPDPAIELDEGSFRNRFHQHTAYSENFVVPSTESDLSIVVSCHSHAPLQEFWDRLPGSQDDNAALHGNALIRSIAVSMPCCAQFGTLLDKNEIISDNCESVLSSSSSSRGSGKRITKKQRKLMKVPIPTEPLLQFDDFEVYSPKRNVRIYAK